MNRRTGQHWLVKGPYGGPDFSGTDYHVHNYVHFIYLVNKALTSAFQNLKKRKSKVAKKHNKVAKWGEEGL